MVRPMVPAMGVPAGGSEGQAASREQPVENERFPAGRAHNPGMTTPITASSPGELLSLVPHLFGFHVDDSVVVLICRGTTVEVSLRFDYWMFDAPVAVRARLLDLLDRFDDPKVFLVAYGHDREQADEALGILETCVEPDLVLDSVVTDGEYWWSRLCDGDCCPPEGNPCDTATPAVAAAIVAGSQPLASRMELEGLVEGPSLLAQSMLLGDLVGVRARVTRSSRARRKRRMLALVRAYLDRPEGAALDAADALELAVLATDIGARDTAWLEMGMATARQHQTLWQQVVASAPDDVAVPALCLMGVAAWLDGNGALLGMCIGRAERLDAGYSMLDVLKQIHGAAAPPTLWKQITA